MLIAVNCFEIEAALKTVAGEIATARSRLAIPYPRSYSVVPFRLIPTPHPGASGLFHSVNSWSTVPFDEVDVGCDHAAVVARARAAIDAIRRRRRGISMSHSLERATDWPDANCGEIWEVARRTGRFPQLVDPRSRLRLVSQVARCWDGIRNFLIRQPEPLEHRSASDVDE